MVGFPHDNNKEMKSFLVLVGLLCLSAVAFAETDEHVVALTSSTFDAEVNKNDITLVEVQDTCSEVLGCFVGLCLFPLHT